MRFIISFLLLCSLHHNCVSAPRIEDVYQSQIGVREATGHNDGPAVEKYLHTVGLGKGFPWCAAFVKWCLLQAGIIEAKMINGMASSCHRPDHLVYFKGKFLQEPISGDVFTLYFASLGRIGHTGFFDKKVNSSIYRSVEGNTNSAGSREGDGVYAKYRSFRATYSISRYLK